MSDIAIRFDGLLLAAAIALSTLIFAIVAASSVILATISETPRTDRFALARRAAALAGFGLSCLAAVLVYMEIGPPPVSTIDWIDWITLPWAILFLFSLVWLFRRGKDVGNNC